MSTMPRALANQANAQLSTGPRTAEGKARSSRNAMTHGLTCRELIVRVDEQEKFKAFRDSLAEELAPEGEIELVTFNELLYAAWNLQRYRRLEFELESGEDSDPVSSNNIIARLERLERYRSRSQRAYYRALNCLRELQTNRALRTAMPDSARAAGVPVLADIRQLTKRTQTAAPPSRAKAGKLIVVPENVSLARHAAGQCPAEIVVPLSDSALLNRGQLNP
jgi:hypothetical protein